MDDNRPQKIGLALAGGGSYAIFQLGVLEKLTDPEKPGFILDKKVKGISGTSGGAVNAIFLSLDNMRLERLRKFWMENNLASIIELSEELLIQHFMRLHSMTEMERQKNDVDSGISIFDASSTAYLNKTLFSLVNDLKVDDSNVNKQLYGYMKFTENFFCTFFPHLREYHSLPKKEIQKTIRIFFRELLVKHLLPPEMRKQKTASFDRLVYDENFTKSYPKISIFVGATNIKESSDHFFSFLTDDTGKHLWKFSSERYRYGISVESILACASVPNVFPAKKFYSFPLFETLGYDSQTGLLFYKKKHVNKGHWGTFTEKGEEADKKTESAYWDGYFLSNPSLEPLLRLNCVEILLVRLASVEDDTVPYYEEEINDRKEVLIQNIATQNELQSIRILNERIEAFGEYIPDKAYAHYIRVHEIRFNKKHILDQVINNPQNSEEYIHLGRMAGDFFRKAYQAKSKIIEAGGFNLSPEQTEIVVDCTFETGAMELTLRDCINDNQYVIKDLSLLK